jgi:hypothetical protein
LPVPIQSAAPPEDEEIEEDFSEFDKELADLDEDIDPEELEELNFDEELRDDGLLLDDDE